MPMPASASKIYAFYLKANGNLVSIGTVLPDSMPAHLAYLEIPEMPGFDDAWDKSQRKFITHPHVPTTKELLLAKNSNAWSDKDIADALKILLSGNPNP